MGLLYKPSQGLRNGGVWQDPMVGPLHPNPPHTQPRFSRCQSPPPPLLLCVCLCGHFPSTFPTRTTLFDTAGSSSPCRCCRRRANDGAIMKYLSRGLAGNAFMCHTQRQKSKAPFLERRLSEYTSRMLTTSVRACVCVRAPINGTC